MYDILRRFRRREYCTHQTLCVWRVVVRLVAYEKISRLVADGCQTLGNRPNAGRVLLNALLPYRCQQLPDLTHRSSLTRLQQLYIMNLQLRGRPHCCGQTVRAGLPDLAHRPSLDCFQGLDLVSLLRRVGVCRNLQIELPDLPHTALHHTTSSNSTS